MRRYLIGFQVVMGLAFAVCAHATDYTVDWRCFLLDGSLSQNASDVFSGTATFGSDTVSPISGDFVFPEANVGDGTGRAIGSIVIECDVRVPTGAPLIHDISVDMLGNLVPGVHATKPFIAWTELVRNISDPNNPTTLVADSGVAYTQPALRHYVFDKPTNAIRIKETFVLDGVTYSDETGRTLIDQSAVASLVHVEKELSFVPEPGQIAGLALGLSTLIAVMRRRGRMAS